MAKSDWKQKYVQFLQNVRKRVKIDERAYTHQRSHPRFQLGSNVIEVSIRHTFMGIDVSAGGISFYSGIPLHPGFVIEVAHKTGLIVEVEVTECAVVEPKPESPDMGYRVHCKFKNPQDGVRFLTEMEESENLTSDMK